MTTLRIALRNYADFENALEEEARLFELAHPEVQVELISIGIHELHKRTLEDGGLRDGRFDLALLVTDWLAEGITSNSLEDLQTWHAKQPIPDWPEGWARSLRRQVQIGEKLSALPWHDGPECLVYRTDLFSDPQFKDEFRRQFGTELKPPSTWVEFERIARFFTRPEENIYGTIFAAFPDGHNTLYDFVLQLWSRGGEITNDDSVPQLTSAEAIAGLEFYRRIVNDPGLCHPKSPQLDSTESGDRFLAGEVAMMANWLGFAARACREGSALAGKVGIAPVPAAANCKHVSLSVFWALAMGAGSHQKELAWEFLRFVSAPEHDLGITRHGTVGVRLSTWRNAELQARIPAYREIESISLGARQLPVGPQVADFAAIIDGVITRALGTEDATVVILEEAQREVERRGLKLL